MSGFDDTDAVSAESVTVPVPLLHKLRRWWRKYLHGSEETNRFVSKAVAILALWTVVTMPFLERMEVAATYAAALRTFELLDPEFLLWRAAAALTTTAVVSAVLLSPMSLNKRRTVSAFVNECSSLFLTAGALSLIGLFMIGRQTGHLDPDVVGISAILVLAFYSVALLLNRLHLAVKDNKLCIEWRKTRRAKRRVKQRAVRLKKKQLEQAAEVERSNGTAV